MNNITVNEVKAYLNIDDELDIMDTKLVELILEAAKSYILNYTGLTLEESSTIKELNIALLLMCSDMYDSRSAKIASNTKVNSTLDIILSMHSRNLIG